MTKHTILSREEALRARDLIRARLGPDRHLKIAAAALTKAQGEGQFIGYASTFDDEPDLAGDVVAPGAFVQSIEDWRARGSWPSLLWQHDVDNPAAVLGVVTDMVEDSRGLLVTGQLDLEHEPAVAVWKAMKSGRIQTFSFAYAILAEHERADGANVLTELDVLDITVTPSPANRNARLVSVKTAAPPRTADPTLNRLNAQLDVLASKRRPVGPEIAAQVEQLVLETKAEFAQQAVDRHEQSRWEQDLHDRTRGLASLSGEDEAAREAERRQREASERAERDHEKYLEQEELTRIDAERREWVRNDPRTLTP